MLLFVRFFLYFKLSWIILVVFVQQCSGKKYDTCEMDGISGTCIPLDKCGQYLSLLKDSATTLQGLDVTQSRQCGFEGLSAKVCCPEEKADNDYVEELPRPVNCGFGLEGKPWVIINTPQPLYNGVTVKDRRRAKWMALLGYKDDGVFWQCGGTIITSRHVLTAAHCIKASLYLVRVGVLDLAEDERENGPIDFLVKRAIPHENYTRYHNDIAIVVLNGTIDFSTTNYLEPVCLPPHHPTYDYTLHEKHKTYVTGWGETEKQGYRPTRLMEAHLNVFPLERCVRAYNRSNLHIDERVLCAGDPQGKHDACNGDSGGPLIQEVYSIVKMTNGDMFSHEFHTQIGVVSYGFKCSVSKFIGVYTNVSHFIPWIEQKVLGKTTVP